MVILTGDTHGSFDRIEDFCVEYDTTTEDTMIILGDAGINYWLDERDEQLKTRLSRLPIHHALLYSRQPRGAAGGGARLRPDGVAGRSSLGAAGIPQPAIRGGRRDL